MNIDPKTVVNHIARRPAHLDLSARTESGRKYAMIAEAIKRMEKSMSYQMGHDEFLKEFGKYGVQSMKINLKRFGIRKPRVVLDAGVIHIWDNGDKNQYKE